MFARNAAEHGGGVGIFSGSTVTLRAHSLKTQLDMEVVVLI